MNTFTTTAYLPNAHTRQHLDIFRPDTTADLRTAVLVLHGGAFMHGDRQDVHARCTALAARGITAIAVGYRLLDTAPWPAQLDDARAALRWTHQHTDDLAIDPTRIAVQGHSAGALLALLLAGTADQATTSGDHTPAPAAAIAYYPPAALSLAPQPGELPAPLLLGPTTTPDDAAAASPIHHINEQFPPTILIHGAADRFIQPTASLRLHDALTTARVTSELHLIAGQDHEFDMTPRYTDTTTELVTRYLHANIIEPDKAAKEVIDANPFASMPPPGPPPGGPGPEDNPAHNN